MPKNDPVNDRYNAPGVNTDDWEETRFSEIDNDTLFYLKAERGDHNHAFRKFDEKSAGDVKTRVWYDFPPNEKIYIKI